MLRSNTHRAHHTYTVCQNQGNNSAHAATYAFTAPSLPNPGHFKAVLNMNDSVEIPCRLLKTNAESPSHIHGMLSHQYETYAGSLYKGGRAPHQWHGYLRTHTSYTPTSHKHTLVRTIKLGDPQRDKLNTNLLSCAPLGQGHPSQRRLSRCCGTSRHGRCRPREFQRGTWGRTTTPDAAADGCAWAPVSARASGARGKRAGADAESRASPICWKSRRARSHLRPVASARASGSECECS